MTRRDAFDGIIMALHGAAFDDSRWAEAAGLIDGACRIKGNILIYGEDTPADDLVIHLHRHCIRGERNEELERLYCEEYHPRDEHLPRIKAQPDSRLALVRDLFTDEEKKTSAVYNEALPMGEMENSLGVRLAGPNGSRILWYLGDPTEGDGWSFEQTDMIERLLPHLRQYVRVRQVLADMGGLKASLATLLDHGATGVIQLNRRGRIVAMNDRAREMLDGGDGVFDRDGFLFARAASDNDTLQGLLARALPPSGGQGVSGSMVVKRQSGLSRPVLHVTPVGQMDSGVPSWDVAALVLSVDPFSRLPLDRALVETALDLSPAESRVAVLLAEGRTVREVAAASGRSENTIRWHVRQIFEKHGITGLGQLLPLVRALARNSGGDS